MATTMKDPPPSSSDTHQSNTPTKQSSSSSTIILDKLKTSIIERLKKINPNKTLSPSQINSIQIQLQRAFPSFHIPTHPTYSTMIEKAIQELNEEDGSSEEAISEYILANFEDLPWAHKRFLSYYLEKLCKDGEVVCVSSNRYSVPWLMDEFSKKKSLMMVEAENLDGNAKNVDVGLFQADEEEADLLVKYRVKRKRNSLVVQDDEQEKAVGTGIVEGHDNVVEISVVPANDDEKVSDDKVQAKGKDGTSEEHHIMAVDEVQSVVAVEQGSPSAPSSNLGDEVTTGGSSMDRDPCEVKSKHMVSTMDKTLSEEHEEELRREKLLSDHTISGATMMLVPSVRIEKLMNEPMNDGVAVVSVSRVDSPKDTSDKLVLEMMDQDSCASDLKIVAVEEGNPISAESREVVCCLFVPQPEQQKTRLMFCPKKKSKQRQVRKLTTSATATPTTASPDFTKGPKMKYVYHLRKKFKPEGFSVRAPDMKLDPKSELMFMEDEDLNLPLQLVVKMHGKQRKSSMHAKVSKSASGSEDPTKKMPLKGKKMTRRKRKLEALQFDGQKSCGSEAVAASESEMFHPFQSQGGSYNDCEGHDDQLLQIAYSIVPPTSEKHDVEPLHEMQVQVTAETSGFDDQRHESGEKEQINGGHGLFHKSEQYDGINLRESSQTEDENALKDVKHPTENNQQQEWSSECATDLILEEADPVVSSVFQEIMEEENEGRIANSPVGTPSVKPLSPSHHDLEYNDMNPSESSKVENENALKDHHQQQERPSEPATNLIVEEAASLVSRVFEEITEQNEGRIANSLVESPSVKPASPSHHDLECNDTNPRESSKVENENAMEDLKQPIEHHQQQEILSEPATSLIVEEAATMVLPVSQGKILEEENDGGIVNPPLDPPSVKLSSPSHLDLEEGPLKQNESMKAKMPCSNQQSLQDKKEVKKIEHRGMPPKNENENQGGAESVYSRSLNQQSDPQNKQRKEDAIDIVVPLSLHDQLVEEQSKSDCSQSFEKEGSGEDVAASVSMNGRQQGLSESGVHQKSDRITIREQINATKEAVTLNSHDQQKEGPLEPATRKVKKKGGRGRPRKIKETAIKDIPAPLDLYAMLQKELAEAAVCQSENKDGENSSRQTEPMTQDGVPLPEDHFLEERDEPGVLNQEPDSTREEDASVLVNLHPQQKKVPSETTNFQPGGRVRQKKEEVVLCEPATSMDEVAVISMHDQQQGLSEQPTSESRKKEMTTEDMVAEQIETANKDLANNLDFQVQQQEGSFVLATHQMKKDSQMKKDGQMEKDGQGRPPESEVAEKSPSDLDELPSTAAIHPSPDASNVFCVPVERKRKQLNVSCPVDKLHATPGEPVSLRTRSRKGGARKAVAAVTLLGYEADHQGEELVLILSDEESHQQQVVPKTDQEKKQWQSSSENTEESEAEVLKQKSCDHILPSAIRRSQRINQRSQAGS